MNMCMCFGFGLASPYALKVHVESRSACFRFYHIINIIDINAFFFLIAVAQQYPPNFQPPQ